MRLKYKIMLLAVVPLLVALGLIALAVQYQQTGLAQQQRLQLRAAYMASKESELRHYVALALSTISPLYNSGRDDAQVKKQAMAQLAKLDYGADGYFYLYDMQGVNLMHPRQPELVGRNLIDLRDAQGDPTIRMLLERARAGGGFVVYQWQKPSTQKVAAKLGYVTQLERWGWMLGTGIYLDEFESVIEQLDEHLQHNAHQTLISIASVGALGVALIFACGLVLSWSESRVSDAKLTLLARKVVNSQEEERAHLARELHDGTSQTLVAVKLLIESAHERLGPAQEAARAPLARALQRLREALAEVRGMSHRLRPVMLDMLGLAAALQNLGDETCGAAGIAFSMEEIGSPWELPDEVKTVLFRITQEALTNVEKHAACQQVTLRLEYDTAALRMSIEDDGAGFDAESVSQDPRRGIGLRNMRERMDGIGGQLLVLSNPGRTRIIAELPRAALRRFAAAAAASASAQTRALDKAKSTSPEMSS